MTDRVRESRSGALRALGVGAVGLAAGAVLFGGGLRAADGAQGGVRSSESLPAITLGANEVALVRGEGGLLFLVGPGGRAAPIRFKDTELRNVPGETLLRVP